MRLLAALTVAAAAVVGVFVLLDAIREFDEGMFNE